MACVGWLLSGLSFFTNRQQYVEYNGICSHTSVIRCGVPQGSILGPLFFLNLHQ